MSKFMERLGVIPALLLGAGLFVIGALALNHIVDNWWPIDVTRLDLIRDTALDRTDAASLLEAANSEVILAFLAAALVMVTGLALPLAHFLNKRFGRETKYPPFLVAMRQAMWVGLWAAFCIWLQMNRAFGLAIAGLVAVVFLLFEILLQIRTQAARVTGGEGAAR